jgi:ABC-type multidrug transport system fused ATPase/permease subunit
MNLMVGLDEEDDKPTDDAIKKACEEANIYDFIMSLS